MKLTLSWHSPTSILLQKPQIKVTRPGFGEVQLTPSNGRASVITSNLIPEDIHVVIQFLPGLAGSSNPVLVINQDFHVTPRPPAVSPTEYRIPDLDNPGNVIVVSGLHPLLRNAVSGDSWQLVVDTRLVDVTSVDGPSFMAAVSKMINPGNASAIRLYAQTDGTLPAFWLVCAPKVCRGAAFSDLLCFFTPSQAALPADIEAQLSRAQRLAELMMRAATFFGQGVHDPNTLPQLPAALKPTRLLDHIEPSSGEAVLSRGWEQALFDSQRHVALVLPVPAGGSHNQAAGPRLPEMLRSVLNLLHAHGVIFSQNVTRAEDSRLALGAHSSGALALFEALGAKPTAYSDLLLFEPVGIQKQLGLIARVPAPVSLGGFSASLCVAPFHALANQPAVAGRVKLLPRGYPGDRPDTASPADIVSRNADTAALLNPRSLGHALTRLPAPWTPKRSPRDERFEVLHQYIVYGGDSGGAAGPASHFLTQALQTSTLR